MKNKKGAMKSGTLWFLLIGIAALFLAGAYLQNHYSVLPGSFSIVGSNSYALDCQTALSKFYSGAQVGGCFMYGLNVNDRSFVRNPAYMYYIESATEKNTQKCTISPTCPTGYKTYCTVVASQDWSKILSSCPTASSDFGTMNCDSTAHCNYPNEVIVPKTCSPTGACLALTDTTHATCLSNGKYSGSLTGNCPVTTTSTIPTCGTGQVYNPTTKLCESSTGTTTTGTNTQTCQFYETMNSSGTCGLNMNLIYIILGIVAVIVVLMLVKK